jgi:oligopeptide/dipeptide ABC transporter ATP-binding protein
MALLEVDDLVLRIRSEGKLLPILESVSLTVEKAETVAIVGETGSGKTMTAKTIMGLLPKTAVVQRGKVTFDGVDLLKNGSSEGRKRIAMIFQNPMSSINPLFRVGEQMQDVLAWSRKGESETKEERGKRIETALESVKLYAGGQILGMYPFQLSGGMRQRVMIAMALLREPELLIADEPTTALDVTTQKEILDLLLDLTRERQMTLILITHSLGIAHETSKRTYVMYAGRVVEYGETTRVFEGPLHPYSQGLISSIPSLDRSRGMEAIPGEISQADRETTACCFSSRCPYVQDRCRTSRPQLKQCGPGQSAACFVVDDRLRR